MRLVVATPTSVVIDARDVREVRAEDPSGGFGIRPGHADFITVLTISVVTWQDAAATEHFVAVRNGVLSVKHGGLLSIATRDARAGPSLGELRKDILQHFRQIDLEEEENRRTSNRLHAATIRQLQRVLEPSQRPMPHQVMPSFGPGATGVARNDPGGHGD